MFPIDWLTVVVTRDSSMTDDVHYWGDTVEE